VFSSTGLSFREVNYALTSYWKRRVSPHLVASWFWVTSSSLLSKYIKIKIFFVCLFLARQPPSGPGPPYSRGFQITHNDAPQSV
jgi:hypothetical protein